MSDAQDPKQPPETAHRGIVMLDLRNEERDQALSRARMSFVFVPVVVAVLVLAGERLATGFGWLLPIVLAHGMGCLLMIRLAERDVGPWMVRLSAGLALDVALCAYALWQGGPWGAVAWLVLLWLVVGIGLRYGIVLMAVAAAECLVASSLLHLLEGYWQEQTVLTASLQGGLVLVPAFYGSLIARVSRLQRSLREAVADAEALAESRSRFLANMSHELRTPMNGVLGITELLEGRLRERENLELVALQRRSGQALLRVIDDVLDLSRLDSGRLELERRDLDLTALVRDVGELLAPRAREKGVRLRVETPDRPVYVRGDDTRLRQLLVNLGGNAVKFTTQGHVRLALALRDDAVAEGLQAVRLTVEDTGIGIPEEARGRIFGDFEQVDPSINRRFGGTGLGLAIVRRLVDAMGGTLAFVSEPGRGSTFDVDLTLPVGAAPAQEERTERSFGWRALVAEDNPVNQLVAQRVLEGLGVHVTMVDDGRQALDRFEAVAPVVVFLDLQMPVLDGPGTARALRARGVEVPIVALTADISARDQPETRALFDAFLSKPFRTADLARCLDGLRIGGDADGGLPQERTGS